ncbi:MAG: hypothetical protein KGH87_00895 [Thaumarchaeota archaeon]|nr:hypothetical protein [Nitrososphaerota archaeon]MDE1838452.1 hypothetical protein [Nitrososphaerota archaeon]
MKTLCLSMIIVVLSLTLPTAFASVDLNAYMAINGHPVTPTFKFSKSVLIDYSSGSTLQKELDGKNVTVAFTDDSGNNPSIQSFVDKLNVDIANERRTSSSITNLTIQYEATIHGDAKQATVDYFVTLKPILVNYVISSGGGDVSTVLDASWIGFSIKDPVVIITKQYGDLEINFPLGIIQNQLPEVYDILKGIPQENILKANLMDASPLVGRPIDQWNTLFDPTCTLDEAAGYEYAGQKVAVTEFAYGQSNPYQASLKPKTADIDFTADSKYHVTTIEKASTGTIGVEGHANGYFVQGMPAISTKIAYTGFRSPTSVSPWWTGIQGIILWLAVAGVGMIIFFVLFFRHFKE